MISNEQYVRLSLDLNLFFLRIVKEHTIFAAASLPPKDAAVSMKLVSMKRNLEKLLSRAVMLSHGNISEQVAASGELVTHFTLPAERAVQSLTGIPIDMSITVQETKLGYRQATSVSASIVNNISKLNQDAILLTSQAIVFKTNLLKNVLSCKAFGYTYPLMLDHVIRESHMYVSLLKMLQNRQSQDTTVRGLIQQEVFWNDIMGEHPEFIRGYLDPSEKELFKKANAFAEQFDELKAATKALEQQPSNFSEVTRESYRLVTELRNFKRQGTEGLLSCKIRAIMPALLADHVTREANHYLRLLRSFQS